MSRTEERRRSRCASWLAFAGVLLLVACIGVSDALLAHWKQLNGPAGARTLILLADGDAPASGAGLTLPEARRLAESWGRAAVYTVRAATDASAAGRSGTASVTGVGGQYDAFARVRLLAGSGVAERTMAERGRAAMISAGLAHRLFGSARIVGLDIRLFGVSFRIVGVFADPTPQERLLLGDTAPDVIVPASTLLELRPSLGIASVELDAGTSPAVANEAEARRLLSVVGRDPLAFRIVNVQQEAGRLDALPELARFVCGAAAIASCLRLIARHGRRAQRLWRSGPDAAPAEASSDADIAKRAGRLFALVGWARNRAASEALAVAAYLAVAAAVWLAVRHGLRMPPELLPDRWSEWPARWQAWLDGRSDSGMPAGGGTAETAYRRADRLVTTIALPGALLGLLALRLGVREWASAGLSLDAQLARLSVFAALAAIATGLAVRRLGVDGMLQAPDALVLAALFWVWAAASRSRRGCAP